MAVDASHAILLDDDPIYEVNIRYLELYTTISA
jgi:hypothetical protein